jgi:hypothetical protein
MSIFRLSLLAVAFAGGIGAAASTAAAPTAKTTPLTAGEIHALYGQKSWIWKEGAGYFSVRERRFTAWSKENGKPSYGIGRWFIPEPGKLCFRADWHAEDGSAPATTCFSHVKRSNVIYQKREPDGEWYVFKHRRARADDEFAKLRRGNYVSDRLEAFQTRISE